MPVTAKQGEVGADHVHGDVPHPNLADQPLGRAVVGVTVEHEVGPMSADRACEPARAEERPDALGLADERLGDRCVVEQDDAAVAAGDRLEALLERGHLVAGLLIEPAEERLAEIGDLGTREATDESLAADDADLDALDLDHGV